ncbi:MAG: hypothetical protein QXE74_08970 [Candidatus Bathyarchaeia archaeon]
MEERISNIKQLSERLEIQIDQLHQILTNLNRHNLVKYDPKTGEVSIPKWLLNINKQMETLKPATGEIVLPKYQEIQIQDVVIGNYTRIDLQLKIRLGSRRKEIAICTMV